MTTPAASAAPTQQFADFGISSETLKSLSDMGFSTPSPIQAQALPLLLGGTSDFLGLAGTGTGKTAAFAIPLIEGLAQPMGGVKALILCPTRELALQVSGQISLIGKHKRIEALPIYGGAGYRDQIAGLKRGMAVVVGTPGRIVDHIERGTLDLSGLTTLILDEADEMISMGFKDELEQILSAINLKQSRIWLFSATMNTQVRSVANKYLRSPQQVQVNRTEVVSSAVEQSYFVTQEINKSEVLCKIIDCSPEFYGIIFCQTKSQVTALTQYLMGRGYGVDCLHGDLNQAARERAMQAFRDRQAKILVCTDVAARGLDVKDVSHVVNYSLPHDQDTYVHRIGRTARSGKAGAAINLITPSQRGLVRRIAAGTKSEMNEGRIPTRKEVGMKKLDLSLEQFTQNTATEKAIELLSPQWKSTLESLSANEIAARFLLMLYPQTFAEIDKPEPILAFPDRGSSSDSRGGGYGGGRSSGGRGGHGGGFGSGSGRPPYSGRDGGGYGGRGSSSGASSYSGRREERAGDGFDRRGGGSSSGGGGGFGGGRPRRSFSGSSAPRSSYGSHRS